MKELGPLQYCNLDDANYMLTQGRASKENAEAYVEMWNKPGMRMTTAKLEQKLVNLGGCACLSPFITIR